MHPRCLCMSPIALAKRSYTQSNTIYYVGWVKKRSDVPIKRSGAFHLMMGTLRFTHPTPVITLSRLQGAPTKAGKSVGAPCRRDNPVWVPIALAKCSYTRSNTIYYAGWVKKRSDVPIKIISLTNSGDSYPSITGA